jgi:hypothetical protein
VKGALVLRRETDVSARRLSAAVAKTVLAPLRARHTVLAGRRDTVQALLLRQPPFPCLGTHACGPRTAHVLPRLWPGRAYGGSCHRFNSGVMINVLARRLTFPRCHGEELDGERMHTCPHGRTPAAAHVGRIPLTGLRVKRVHLRHRPLRAILTGADGGRPPQLDTETHREASRSRGASRAVASSSRRRRRCASSASGHGAVAATFPRDAATYSQQLCVGHVRRWDELYRSSKHPPPPSRAPTTGRRGATGVLPHDSVYSLSTVRDTPGVPAADARPAKTPRGRVSFEAASTSQFALKRLTRQRRSDLRGARRLRALSAQRHPSSS